MFTVFLLFPLCLLYTFKLSRLLPAPWGNSTLGKVHFLTSYV